MTRWKGFGPVRRPYLLKQFWQSAKLFFSRFFRRKSPWKQSDLKLPYEPPEFSRWRNTGNRKLRNRRAKYGGTAQRRKYRRTTARKKRRAA